MTRKNYRGQSRSLEAVSRVHGHRRLLFRLLKLARANREGWAFGPSTPRCCDALLYSWQPFRRLGFCVGKIHIALPRGS